MRVILAPPQVSSPVGGLTRGPASRALLYGVLGLVGLLMVIPFYWMVAGSMMPPVELYSSTLHLWPQHPSLDSYARVFELVPMGQYFFNSFVTSLIPTAVAVLVSSAAGYAFAQLRFL